MVKERRALIRVRNYCRAKWISCCPSLHSITPIYYSTFKDSFKCDVKHAQNVQCVTVCAHCVLRIVPGISDAVSSVAVFSICWHRVIQTITNNV